MNRTYCVYIMTDCLQTGLYIDVTNDLKKRVCEHKNKTAEGYTQQCNADKLVYYELASTAEAAQERVEQLKRLHPAWKITLIRKLNPEFEDLSLGWKN